MLKDYFRGDQFSFSKLGFSTDQNIELDDNVQCHCRSPTVLFFAGFLLTLMVVIYLTSMFVLSAPSSGDDGGGDLLVSALFNFNTSTSPPQRNRGNHIRTCTHRESDTAVLFIYFCKMCTSTSM